MPEFAYPLVGSFYRPPAQAICRLLPAGTGLSVLAETENAFDVNAIGVWLNAHEIPEASREAIDVVLATHGQNMADALAQDSAWQLGYIKKEFAAILRREAIVTVDGYMVGTFSRTPQGAFLVMLDHRIINFGK
jgi:hypothetical protein